MLPRVKGDQSCFPRVTRRSAGPKHNTCQPSWPLRMPCVLPAEVPPQDVSPHWDLAEKLRHRVSPRQAQRGPAAAVTGREGASTPTPGPSLLLSSPSTLANKATSSSPRHPRVPLRLPPDFRFSCLASSHILSARTAPTS